MVGRAGLRCGFLVLLTALSVQAFVSVPSSLHAPLECKFLRSESVQLCSDTSNAAPAFSRVVACRMGTEMDQTDRRHFLRFGSAVAGALLGVDGMLWQQADAAESEPQITQKVFMDIKIQGVNAASVGASGRDSNLDKQAATEGRIVIGLFGNEAPGTVASFQQLFAGTLVRPCQDIEIEGVTARDTLQKQAPLKKCRAAASQPINLEDSQVWRIIKNRRIDFGRLKGKFLLRQAESNQDANGLSHDRAGRVSTKKGGGQFEFLVAPAAAPDLDEANIVFGQVLEGEDLILRLNDTPVKQFAGNLGGGKEDASSTSSVCYYGGKDAFCGANKPLQKISVVRAGLL